MSESDGDMSAGSEAMSVVVTSSTATGEMVPSTRRSRLQRSERLRSDNSNGSAGSGGSAAGAGAGGGGAYTSWETLVRDSFGHVAWPMKITSWELVPERPDSVPKSSSSATELISRRGVFSRRHYGSVDQLPQTELDGLDPNSRRFRLENGESLAEIDEVFGSPSAPILENPEQQTRWYFKYFLGRVHQNYVGIDTEKNPYFLSIVSQESGNQYMPLYRVILFRKEGAQKIALPYVPQQKTTVKQLLAHFAALDASKSPKELFAADIQKDLLLLEEQEGSVNFKFGVVYMKAGQQCDDEMLSNEHGSAEFEQFLQLLGERITLRGWERFRGGLDVKGDMTGKQSVYTLYEGHEIMFHVSTLLPFSQDNRQQVERKRHIGNDIVNVVFVDGDIDDADFQPTCIKSQFTHIFAVVSLHRGAYKLAIHCDETVPPFGPTLPNPPYFTDANAFREFLLVKLINGEKATFQTPTFARKRERTLEMLIKDLYEENVHDGKLNMLNRRAFSEVLYDSPRSSKLKEDARQVEFVRIGQALKLEAIVRGDAPTSLASAAGTGSVFRRPPWESQCFYAAFHARGTREVCGDSVGTAGIFVASEEGTFMIREDQTQQLVFDRTLAVRQISVLEEHGLLLVRGGSPTNKDGHRVHCFKLDEFIGGSAASGGQPPVSCRSRADVRSRRMEKTRGTHLHTVSRSRADGLLRLAVAAGRKLITYQWRYTAAWAAWCPTKSSGPAGQGAGGQEVRADVVDGWIVVREQQLHDAPTILTILESQAAERGLLICIGFKNHFELYCAMTGVSTKLHEVESSKHSQTHLVAALDLCDGQETELLLCYNHTCHFHKLGDIGNPPSTSHNAHTPTPNAGQPTLAQSQTNPPTTEFDFQWNNSPTSVICAFPYILGFSGDSMEIRLLVNGNLVHTVTMADLTLLTAKRDIYFSTTAPEFIQPVDNRIRDSEDYGAGGCVAAAAASAAAIVVQPTSSVSTPRGSEGDVLALLPDGLLPLPAAAATGVASRPEHCIQRARSLQKPRNIGCLGASGGSLEVHKRNISKSVSCTEAGDSSCSSPMLQHLQHTGQTLAAVAVPPNTPRLSSGSVSDYAALMQLQQQQQQPVSPGGGRNRLGTGRLSLRSNSSPFHSYHSDISSTGSSGSSGSSSGASGTGGNVGAAASGSGQSATGAGLKPLRIFRIPMSNLIGNHPNPYHMRSASVKRPSSLSSVTHQRGTPVHQPLAAEPVAIANVEQRIAEGRQTVADVAEEPAEVEAEAEAEAEAEEEADTANADADGFDLDEAILEANTVGIGVKQREKFNEMSSFSYGCAEPLFTSL